MCVGVGFEISSTLVQEEKNQFILGRFSTVKFLWPSVHMKFRENDHHDDSNESSKSINKHFS